MLLRVLDLVFPFFVLKVPVCVFGGVSALQMQGPLIKVDTVAAAGREVGETVCQCLEPVSSSFLSFPRCCEKILQSFYLQLGFPE